MTDVGQPSNEILTSSDITGLMYTRKICQLKLGLFAVPSKCGWVRRQK